MTSRRRFLAALLAGAGLPLSLVPGARSVAHDTDPARVAEVAQSLNLKPPPEDYMHPKTKSSLILAAAAALLALGVVLGVAIERTPTPGDAPLTIYAAELQARGAGQGGTLGDLVEFLTKPLRHE